MNVIMTSTYREISNRNKLDTEKYNKIKFLLDSINFYPKHLTENDQVLLGKIVSINGLFNSDATSMEDSLFQLDNLFMKNENFKLKMRENEILTSLFTKLSQNSLDKKYEDITKNETEKKKQQIVFFKDKAKEYRAQCKCIDRELRENGFTKILTNIDKFKDLTNELDKINKKIEEYEKTIQIYKEMPTDPILAKLKLENAINKLYILEHNLNERTNK